MSASLPLPEPAARPVVIFHCEGGTQADPAVEPALPGTAWIRVPCVGRVCEGDVLRALRLGAPAVWLVSCGRGECRFHGGGTRAAEVVDRVRRTLLRYGLPEGRVAWLPAGGGTEALAAVTARLSDLPAARAPGPADDAFARRAMPPRAPWPHHGALQEASLLGLLSGERPSAAPSYAAPKEGLGGGGTDLLYGCDLPAVEELLGAPFGAAGVGVRRAALHLARAAGLRPVVSEALPGCGHDFRIAGDLRTLSALAGRTREALQATGAGRLVTLCPECAETLQGRYPLAGAALGMEVVDLLDLLHARKLSLRFESGAAPIRVALYVDVDARTEERQSQAAGLLEQAGCAVVARLPDPFAEPGSQGSAGVQGFVACDREAREAQRRLLGVAESAGAELLVCASPLAAVHLGCAQRRGAWRTHRLAVTTVYEALAARLAPAPLALSPEGE